MKLKYDGLLYKYLTGLDDVPPQSICSLPWALLRVTLFYVVSIALICFVLTLFIVVPLWTLVGLWVGLPREAPGAATGLVVWAIYLCSLVCGFCGIQIEKYKARAALIVSSGPYEHGHIVSTWFSDLLNKTCTPIRWE